MAADEVLITGADETTWEYALRHADRAAAAARARAERERVERERQRRSQVGAARAALQAEFDSEQALQGAIVGLAERDAARRTAAVLGAEEAAGFVARRDARMRIAEDERLRRRLAEGAAPLEEQRRRLGLRSTEELRAHLAQRLHGQQQQQESPRPPAAAVMSETGTTAAQLWGLGELHGSPGRLRDEERAPTPPPDSPQPQAAEAPEPDPAPAPAAAAPAERGPPPKRTPELYGRGTGLRYAPAGGHPQLASAAGEAASPRAGDGGGDLWYDPIDSLGLAGDLSPARRPGHGAAAVPSAAAVGQHFADPMPPLPAVLAFPGSRPVHDTAAEADAAQLPGAGSSARWAEAMRERVRRRREHAPAQRQLRQHFSNVLAKQGPPRPGARTTPWAAMGLDSVLEQGPRGGEAAFAARATHARTRALRLRWAHGAMREALYHWQEPPSALPEGYALRRLAEDSPPPPRAPPSGDEAAAEAGEQSPSPPSTGAPEATMPADGFIVQPEGTVVSVSDPTDAWVAKVDPRSGHTYYMHNVTGETAWQPPHDAADSRWGAGPPPASEAPSASQRHSLGPLWEDAELRQELAAQAEASGEWERKYDPRADRCFFVHRDTRSTCWDLGLELARLARADKG